MIRPAPSSLVAAVAGYGVPGADATLPTAALDADAWNHLVEEVRRERVQGPLALAIAEGAFPATADQAGEAFAVHAEAMSRVLLLEAVLLETCGMLTAAGVETRVLKGSAFARLDYPDPALRSFIDVDVLVRSEQLARAVEVLEASGCRRGTAEPRPGFDRRFGKGADFVSPRSCGIDLHRTLVQGPFGLTVDLDDLFAAATPFEIGGRKLNALGREQRFLHACFHAALGDFPPRLVPLRDVAVMLLGSGGIDTALVLEMAGRWRATAVVARAVSSAGETLSLPPTTPLLEWARRYRAGPHDRLALAAYTGTDRSYARQALAAVIAIPHFKAKGAYLRAIIFPERAAITMRHTGRLARWRSGANQLLGRRPS